MLETCPQCNQLSLIKEPLGRELNMSTGVSKDLIEYKCLNCKNTLTKQLTLSKGGHCGPPIENVTGIHRKDEIKILIKAIDVVHLPNGQQLRTMKIERYNYADDADDPTPPDPIDQTLTA